MALAALAFSFWGANGVAGIERMPAIAGRFSCIAIARAALLGHVAVIVCARAGKNVRGVYAAPVIAMVTCHFVGQERTDVQRERDPMRAQVFTIDPDYAVSVDGYFACPFPTASVR